MRILIAEDDATSRLALSATLRQSGHEVTAVEDGRLALSAWRDDPRPVVISDWRMPHMDGLALCREIRAVTGAPYTYFILLTASGEAATFKAAVADGVDDFLVKPADEEQLTARLAVAERIRSLHLHLRQLEGLLPICAYCKRIRDDGGWTPVEVYVSRRTEATFSHGVCPTCLERALEPD